MNADSAQPNSIETIADSQAPPQSGREVVVRVSDLSKCYQMYATPQDRLKQSRVIQDGVARFRIRQKLHEIHRVPLGRGQGPDDEIKIRRGKTIPTICSNHRD